MRYPNTKKEAKDLTDIGANWGAPKGLGQMLVHYMHDLGAKHDLPTDKQELVDHINRFHKKMTVENIHFPKGVPFHIIYPMFCSAVLNDTVKLPDFQPHAIKNQLQAFKEWMQLPNTKERILEAYYKEFPDRKPKQLKCKDTKIKDWSDEWVQEQYQKIVTIFAQNEDVPIFNTSGAESYFNRIKTEAENRGLV